MTAEAMKRIETRDYKLKGSAEQAIRQEFDSLKIAVFEELDASKAKEYLDSRLKEVETLDTKEAWEKLSKDVSTFPPLIAAVQVSLKTLSFQDGNSAYNP